MLYARFLGKTLTERCNELGARAAECSLESELAVVRALVIDASESYENAVAAGIEAGATPMQLSAIKLAAKAVLVDALKDVADMAIAHRKVVTTEGALAPATVQTVILQAVAGIDETLQELAPQLRQGGLDPTNVAQMFDSKLKQLRLPAVNDPTSQSSFEPNDFVDADEEAAAMDATVPLGPHSLNGTHKNGAA